MFKEELQLGGYIERQVWFAFFHDPGMVLEDLIKEES